MPIETTTTCTCENPGCAPKQVTQSGANVPLPDDWYIVIFQGVQHIFHSAACAAAWLALQP